MSKNIHVLSDYLSFFYFIICSLVFCCFMLFISWLLGGKSVSRYKHTPFESGIISVGDTNFRFSFKFYLIAIFFVIFDVEALYLYAWSISINESGWIGFFEASMFVLSILLALFYLFRIKALGDKN